MAATAATAAALAVAETAGAPPAPMTTTVGYREILGDIGRYRGDIGWGSAGPDDDDGGI